MIAVFIDPRTDPSNPSSNHRMIDYSANDSFLDFLEKEIIPKIIEGYPISKNPEDWIIAGASMGGLIATYAVLKRPQIFHKCAAQSPAYLQADGAVIKLAEKTKVNGIKVYIDSGKFFDTEKEANKVVELLKKNGAEVKFLVVPEGHNWTNWSARIPVWLNYFLGNE